ncbi:DNA repair protein REV1 [Thraustotheca clavata]|uniref:DNA repair protein REV1 n=1 Tax=Thraustotheca clavata TaxID=74557 RepID=A0A1V9YBG7_9STRA|nr:DNA repair protein REV1 [Thraustotheca clavata]
MPAVVDQKNAPLKTQTVVNQKITSVNTQAASIQPMTNLNIAPPVSVPNNPALPPRPPKKAQPTAIAQNDSKRKPMSTRDGAAVFVRFFFQNSRLHHIGSWKSFFQSHALELMAKAPTYDASLYGNCTGTDRVILHVDMDCFFVSVAIRNLPPVYKDLPIAVAHSGYSSHDDPKGQNKKGTSKISP